MGTEESRQTLGITGKLLALQSGLSFLLNPEDEEMFYFFVPEPRGGFAFKERK